MRAVILNMIQRDPAARLSAKDYLTSWGPSVFPEYFTSFLQPFCQTLLPLSADLRLAAVQQAFPQMLHFMAPGTGASPDKGLGWVQNREMVRLPSQLQLQQPGPAQLAECTDQVGILTSIIHFGMDCIWHLDPVCKTTNTLGVVSWWRRKGTPDQRLAANSPGQTMPLS